MASNIYYTIICIIIVLVVFTYLFFKFDISPKFRVYLETLALAGTILIFITYFENYAKENEKKEMDRFNVFVQQGQADWIELEQMFMIYYPYTNRLYQQIYGNNKSIQSHNITDDTTIDQNKVKMYEAHMSSILFQMIENIHYGLLNVNISSVGQLNTEWLNIWKSWLKSEIILEQWGYMRNFYSKETQDIIDNIILSNKNEKK
ncbi:MAG: hypothetical protein Edafosvirus3_72 [Edafosvirus sp.]|uniref:DUF4760 domain-containing protein n=1 Tax=Edafosvirus sp. TaxID=2487765 RepID=A0A3G4ZUK5_9VIRU|nr:MAG: hypothetical protein Edafosvirus3_72 [Edafosvirus sp.]